MAIKVEFAIVMIRLVNGLKTIPEIVEALPMRVTRLNSLNMLL